MASFALISAVGLLNLTEVAVGARVSGEVGRAPLTVGGPQETIVAGVLAPFAAAKLYDRRGELVLRYAPTWRRQRPSPEGTSAPLVLHQADLSASWQATRRTRLLASTTGAYGEASYTDFGQALGEDQATDLQLDRLRFGSLSIMAGLQHQLTERYELSLQGRSTARRPFGVEESSLFPRTRTYELTFAHQYLVTRRDSLSNPTTLGYFKSDQDVRAHSASSSLVWARQLSRDSTFTLEGGVSYVRQRQPERTTNAATPVIGAGYSAFLGRAWGGEFSWSANSRLQSTVDQVLGEVRPVATLSTSLLYTNYPWTAVATAGGATAATREPSDRAQGETVGRGSFTVSRELTRWLSADAGVRGDIRKPHWAERPFATISRQGWVFLGLSGVVGSGRDAGRWAR